MKTIIIVLVVLLAVISFIVGLAVHMNNYFNKKLDDINKGDLE